MKEISFPFCPDEGQQFVIRAVREWESRSSDGRPFFTPAVNLDIDAVVVGRAKEGWHFRWQHRRPELPDLAPFFPPGGGTMFGMDPATLKTGLVLEILFHRSGYPARLLNAADVRGKLNEYSQALLDLPPENAPADGKGGVARLVSAHLRQLVSQSDDRLGAVVLREAMLLHYVAGRRFRLGESLPAINRFPVAWIGGILPARAEIVMESLDLERGRALVRYHRRVDAAADREAHAEFVQRAGAALGVPPSDDLRPAVRTLTCSDQAAFTIDTISGQATSVTYEGTIAGPQNGHGTRMISRRIITSRPLP